MATLQIRSQMGLQVRCLCKINHASWSHSVARRLNMPARQRFAAAWQFLKRRWKRARRGGATSACCSTARCVSIGYFAASSGAAIVPVAFRGTKELWFRKHIMMVVGPPIPGQKGSKEVADRQTAATAAAILAAMPPLPAQNPKSRQFLKKFLTELFTQEVKDHPVPID